MVLRDALSGSVSPTSDHGGRRAHPSGTPPIGGG